MGIYLNSTAPLVLYSGEMQKPYFVDKTMLLTELFPLIRQGNQHICIIRPRRFGKTIMANMVGAFLGKGIDGKEIFDKLKIATQKDYQENLNQHNVVYIDFSKIPDHCKSYEQYINRIKVRLIRDLKKAYPDAEIGEEDSLGDVFSEIFAEYDGERFVFVLDEWDCIFHKDFITEEDKRSYLSFLGNLLKDQAYVSMTYMTGILPIAKYSSGSELNMFAEYMMASEAKFSEYFGFTETEVDDLYARYLQMQPQPAVTREGLREWYDGYYTMAGDRVYNPRSVVLALTNNNLGNYWTSSGPYDEIFYYMRQNVDDVQKDLALMASGEEVPVKIREYAATSMDLSTREEIFSAMVVYGFLNYRDGSVSIPNHELMAKFDEMIRKESSLGYVNRLARKSERMLAATLAGDTDTMAEILEYVHNTETPLLSYNHETELSAIVNLVYLSARDQYDVEREDKAGIGYVDFIFYPVRKNEDCMILELKVDHTPEEAIRQIIEKQYALRFAGKIGEKERYTGRILAVGIGYSKTTKAHRCKVEVLK